MKVFGCCFISRSSNKMVEQAESVIKIDMTMQVGCRLINLDWLGGSCDMPLVRKILEDDPDKQYNIHLIPVKPDKKEDQRKFYENFKGYECDGLDYQEVAQYFYNKGLEDARK